MDVMSNFRDGGDGRVREVLEGEVVGGRGISFLN